MGVVLINFSLLDEDQRTNYQERARDGAGAENEVREVDLVAGWKWAKTVGSGEWAKHLEEEALLSAFKAIGVVMTGVDALLEEGVNPVCVVGSDASNSVLANVLSVAAQYALLRHGLDRVGLLLNSKSLQVNAEDQNFLAVQSGDMERLRAWGAELVLTNDVELMASIKSLWPDVVIFSVVSRFAEAPGNLIEVAPAEHVVAMEDEQEEEVHLEVVDEGRKRGRDESGLPLGNDDNDGDQGAAEKQRRVDDDEELDVDILDEAPLGDSAVVDVAALAPIANVDKRVQVPSNEEESQEGSARDGPDLTFDMEASEKSLTEAVEGRRHHHHHAMPEAAQQQKEEEEFVAPAPNRVVQDDLDMEEINQLIGEELASL